MTDPVWQTVITGATGLGGAWLGGWMSRAAGERQHQQRVREERRIQLHSTVAQVVADVEEKLEGAWVLIPAFAKMRDSDMLEYVNTDTAREQRAREARIRTAMVELGLSVRDPRLRTPLIALDKALGDWPDKAMDPVTRPGRTTTDVEAVGEAWKHVRYCEAVLKDFKEAATSLLAVALDEQADGSA